MITVRLLAAKFILKKKTKIRSEYKQIFQRRNDKILKELENILMSKC